jgi:hypothetical protein
MASTQLMHDRGGIPVERVHSRQSRMSIGTMDSHATVTEGGKRRSGGFLGFGRKKDKPKVEEEDEVSGVVGVRARSVSLRRGAGWGAREGGSKLGRAAGWS